MRKGELTVVTGPMFSGKTSFLISVIQEAENAGKVVEVFKPRIDTRNGLLTITSHSGVSYPCHTLALDAFALPNGVDVLVIDEVQFLNQEAVSRIVEAVKCGVRVFVGGLEQTSSGEPFGILPELLEKATHKIWLKATCSVCGKTADKTYRKSEETETILLGGSDKYEPRCTPCWVQVDHLNSPPV